MSEIEKEQQIDEIKRRIRALKSEIQKLEGELSYLGDDSYKAITELNLRPEMYLALRRNGIYTIEQLIEVSKGGYRSLMNLYNIGFTRAEQILTILKECGYIDAT